MLVQALILAGLLFVQEPDVDTLLKQLGDESIEVREKAAAGLVELGEKAEEKVKAFAATAGEDLKQACNRILGHIAVSKRRREIFPPLRRVTLEARNRHVKDVFDDLKKQAGFGVTFDGATGGDVTVSIKDAAPLEALDALCKAANLGYSFKIMPSGRRTAGDGPPLVTGEGLESPIRIQAGYVPLSRLFVRHYVVEPVRVRTTRSTEFHPTPSGANVEFQVVWSPDVKPDEGEISVTSVSDDKGRPFTVPKTSAGQYHRAPGVELNGIQAAVALTNPEQDAGSLTVKGTVRLKFLLEEKFLSFEELGSAEPVKKELSGIVVEVRELKAVGDRVHLKMTVSRTALYESKDPNFASGRYKVRTRLQDGSVTYPGGASHTGIVEIDIPQVVDGGSFHVKGKFKALEIVVDTVKDSDSFDFELKDIPLPK